MAEMTRQEADAHWARHFHAKSERLKAEVERLREMVRRAQPVVLKRYLDSGGLHAALLVEMRQECGLPDTLTQEERNLAQYPLVIDAALAE